MPVLAAKGLRVKGVVLRAKELSIARTHTHKTIKLCSFIGAASTCSSHACGVKCLVLKVH